MSASASARTARDDASEANGVRWQQQGGHSSIAVAVAVGVAVAVAVAAVRIQ
jgi:hypothetical protein